MVNVYTNTNSHMLGMHFPSMSCKQQTLKLPISAFLAVVMEKNHNIHIFGRTVLRITHKAYGSYCIKINKLNLLNIAAMFS